MEAISEYYPRVEKVGSRKAASNDSNHFESKHFRTERTTIKNIETLETLNNRPTDFYSSQDPFHYDKSNYLVLIQRCSQGAISNDGMKNANATSATCGSVHSM